MIFIKNGLKKNTNNKLVNNLLFKEQFKYEVRETNTCCKSLLVRFHDGPVVCCVKKGCYFDRCESCPELKNLTQKNIVTLRDCIPELLNAMVENENSIITNPLRAKINPSDKLVNYRLTLQQRDIISWCIAKEYKKRLSRGQTVPEEYLVVNYKIFPES